VPDKDILAFTRSGQLWIMKTDGSNAGVFAALKDASFWFPEASPKGTDFIAWMSRSDGTQNIVRVTLDGKLTELTSIDDRAKPPMKNLRLSNTPHYDSKAQRIAYSFNGNIWIMNRDGENPETLVADGNSYAPAWSPDDKKIAYVNGKNGHYDLWITDVASRDTYQVTDFQDYTVGQPRWMADSQRLIITRSQKDESDVASVVAVPDQPLVDADVITNDHLSASAILDLENRHLLFSSARMDPPNWEIWLTDALGKEGKALTVGGGVSPAWLKPQEGLAVPASMSAPKAVPSATPVSLAVAKPIPTKAPTPSETAAKPVPTTQAKPVVTAATAKTGVPVTLVTPAQKTSPTHLAVKAPPLRLRLKAGFDPESDELQPASLAELKKMVGRVKQYAGESIQVYGPLDRSPLKGHYASLEERSQVRASQIAVQLIKEAALPANSVQALPYTPVSLGEKSVNGIQIYVVLK
jgi:outer membrane protein OmpA-like peptidoglycan-associated protein